MQSFSNLKPTALVTQIMSQYFSLLKIPSHQLWQKKICSLLADQSAWKHPGGLGRQVVWDSEHDCHFRIATRRYWGHSVNIRSREDHLWKCFFLIYQILSIMKGTVDSFNISISGKLARLFVFTYYARSLEHASLLFWDLISILD